MPSYFLKVMETSIQIPSMKEFFLKLPIQSVIYLLNNHKQVVEYFMNLSPWAHYNTVEGYSSVGQVLDSISIFFQAEGFVLMWTSERLQCSVKPGWPCLFPTPLIPHSPLSLHQSMHCIALHCIALHCIAPELPALHRSPMRACKVGHVSTSRPSLGLINTFFAPTLLLASRHATLHQD